MIHTYTSNSYFCLGLGSDLSYQIALRHVPNDGSTSQISLFAFLLLPTSVYSAVQFEGSPQWPNITILFFLIYPVALELEHADRRTGERAEGLDLPIKRSPCALHARKA